MNIQNTSVLAFISLGLISCGGSSGQKQADVSVNPTQPPVTTPAGLTLEELVAQFSASGLTIQRQIVANISVGSGDEITEQAFDFLSENANGANVCVNYLGQNVDSVVASYFTFSDKGCGIGLNVGGKSDISKVISDVSSYVSRAFISSQVAGKYDIFKGATSVSFKLNNGDILNCNDSVTVSSALVSAIYNADTGMIDVSVDSGVFADESFEGEKFSVSGVFQGSCRLNC